MSKFLEKHKDKTPKYLPEFIAQIKLGKQYKREILDIIRPNIKLSGADAPLRRALLNAGLIDDIHSPITKYSYPGATHDDLDTIFGTDDELRELAAEIPDKVDYRDKDLLFDL